MTTLDADATDDDVATADPEAAADQTGEADDDMPPHDVHDTLIDVPDEELEPQPVAAADDDGERDEDEEAVEAPTAVVAPTGEPMTRRQHRAAMKASAVRVRRVVRHVDPWSVFKVASLFIICLWGVVVLASLLIWRAAVESGSVESTEELIVDVGFSDFDFDPQQMFEALLGAGAVLAVATIFFTVLLTILFNLICDLTGGLRITMIEQDLADARRRGRRTES